MADRSILARDPDILPPSIDHHTNVRATTAAQGRKFACATIPSSQRMSRPAWAAPTRHRARWRQRWQRSSVVMASSLTVAPRRWVLRIPASISRPRRRSMFVDCPAELAASQELAKVRQVRHVWPSVTAGEHATVRLLTDYCYRAGALVHVTSSSTPAARIRFMTRQEQFLDKSAT